MISVKKAASAALVTSLLCGCSVNISDIDKIVDTISSFTESDSSHSNFTSSGISPDNGNLNVFYIDVGQGDSELIEFPDGKTMLIDAGEADSADNVINQIKSEGISKLDYVVATHPHADHIGGMSLVLDKFDIGTVYMPDAEANTRAFTKMLDVIEKKDIPVEQASAGVKIPSAGGVSINILAPNSTNYEELNDYSAVIKLTYGSTSFLFMGDAEKLSEDEITADVSCDVIKVGHHGSKTSSSADFVKRTKAKYAVISAGEGNSYGLPKENIVKRWKSSGAEVIRTDEDGTIIFTSDGKYVERVSDQ